MSMCIFVCVCVYMAAKCDAEIQYDLCIHIRRSVRSPVYWLMITLFLYHLDCVRFRLCFLLLSHSLSLLFTFALIRSLMRALCITFAPCFVVLCCVVLCMSLFHRVAPLLWMKHCFRYIENLKCTQMSDIINTTIHHIVIYIWRQQRNAQFFFICIQFNSPKGNRIFKKRQTNNEYFVSFFFLYRLNIDRDVTKTIVHIYTQTSFAN